MNIQGFLEEVLSREIIKMFFTRKHFVKVEQTELISYNGLLLSPFILVEYFATACIFDRTIIHLSINFNPDLYLEVDFLFILTINFQGLIRTFRFVITQQRS